MRGMLWLDSDPKRTLEEKIRRAVDAYQKKMSKEANSVMISEVDAKDVNLKALSKTLNLTITTEGWILDKHFLVGVEDETLEKQR